MLSRFLFTCLISCRCVCVGGGFRLKVRKVTFHLQESRSCTDMERNWRAELRVALLATPSPDSIQFSVLEPPSAVCDGVFEAVKCLSHYTRKVTFYTLLFFKVMQ